MNRDRITAWRNFAETFQLKPFSSDFLAKLSALTDSLPEPLFASVMAELDVLRERPQNVIAAVLHAVTKAEALAKTDAMQARLKAAEEALASELAREADPEYVWANLVAWAETGTCPPVGDREKDERTPEQIERSKARARTLMAAWEHRAAHGRPGPLEADHFVGAFLNEIMPRCGAWARRETAGGAPTQGVVAGVPAAVGANAQRAGAFRQLATVLQGTGADNARARDGGGA